MKPCDCKDMQDVMKLKEHGLSMANTSIEVIPNVVLIGHKDTTIRISMRTFKMLADWYLEEQ